MGGLGRTVSDVASELGCLVPYRHYVFYNYNDEAGDLSGQKDLFDEIYRHTVSAFASEYLWYPYRYELAWNEYPDTIEMVATYPLGEQRQIVVDADIATRRKAVFEDLPMPPPILPTTPFIDPWYPESADALGRNCPPVEEIWEGKGVEVTDPCTLAAISRPWTGCGGAMPCGGRGPFETGTQWTNFYARSMPSKSHTQGLLWGSSPGPTEGYSFAMRNGQATSRPRR